MFDEPPGIPTKRVILPRTKKLPEHLSEKEDTAAAAVRMMNPKRAFTTRLELVVFQMRTNVKIVSSRRTFVRESTAKVFLPHIEPRAQRLTFGGGCSLGPPRSPGSDAIVGPNHFFQEHNPPSPCAAHIRAHAQEETTGALEVLAEYN